MIFDREMWQRTLSQQNPREWLFHPVWTWREYRVKCWVKDHYPSVYEAAGTRRGRP